MNRSLVGAAGAAVVAGLATLATLAIDAPQPASAQEEFRVTAQQLKINQRISQAGVRRANEALARLDALPKSAGLPGPQGQPGPAGAAGPLRLTYFADAQRPPRIGDPVPAPIAPPEGDTTFGPEPVGVERVQWPAEGTAWVVLKGSPRKCALSASIYGIERGQIAGVSPFAEVGLPPNTVQVHTAAPDGTPSSRSFHLTVFCP